MYVCMHVFNVLCNMFTYVSIYTRVYVGNALCNVMYVLVTYVICVFMYLYMHTV
jgi:hypothetical protein